MFSPPPSPIAIDFGSSSVKMLQVDPRDGGSIMTAAELPIPDDARQSSAERARFLEHHLPEILKSSGFKGRRAVCAVPAGQTILQHMQLAIPEGVKTEAVVRSQLQISLGIAPDSVVVRSHEVAELNRDGQSKTEVICIAIPRDVIMKHISLLESCRLEVIGIHAQASAMLRAFDYVHRRSEDDETTTMYIDLGYSSTSVVVGHGRDMTFARAIQIGGQHFDQHIAKTLETDLSSARAHRLSLLDPPGDEQTSGGGGSAADEAPQEGLARLQAAMARDDGGAAATREEATTTATAQDRRDGKPAPGLVQGVQPGEGHTSAANVDFSELLETITDELSMCLRYHRGVFPSRAINRVILVGGEARQNWLCRHVAKALRLPARLGDPLARFSRSDETAIPALDNSSPQPGWATVCGLCSADA